ncbi:ABC transporter permease subunit [Salinactinospora qingdaonensis]|uniref:ABC-2 type transport system permease protein n=1 Tax=Salinactinospora qingdaonensis TaxID=702744 RepID=A0ABP7FR00_9ACTN
MLRNVFAKFLRDHLRALLGWSVGVVLVTAMYSSFYPTMTGDSTMAALAEAEMRGMGDTMTQALNMTDLTSPEGYLNATVFSLLVPILLVIAAITVGTRAIAGDEEEGGLELLLAHPVSRTRLVVERFLGLVVFVSVLGALVYATLLTIGPGLDLDVDRLNLLAACVVVTLLALSYGSVALAVGAVTGRRATALAVAALLAVVGFLGNTFALQVEELEWLRFASAFYYALDSDPLATGFHAGFIAVLIAVPVVLLSLAVSTFTRRDVGV